MVAFHIEDYCLNFIDCCHRRLGCRVDRKTFEVEHGSRIVKVGTADDIVFVTVRLSFASY